MAPPPPPPPPPPPSPPPPAPLMEELVEEILLRFPPHEPACLFRAALVCKPWCRLISGPRFRRRYGEFHRTPPMLGFLCNAHGVHARFVPTTTFCWSRTNLFHWDVLDARHGRVLVKRRDPDDVLLIWDPLTDEQREMPMPPQPLEERTIGSTAAVLCAGASAGACKHLDCHREPFLVVFVGFDQYETFVCTYSSDVAIWSEPISTQNPDDYLDYCTEFAQGAVLTGNALYFGITMLNITLKYNLESRELSWIQLPDVCFIWRSFVLTSTEEGELGLVTVGGSKLYIWSRKDAPGAHNGWVQSSVVDLKTLRPIDVYTPLGVLGFADGLDIVFMTVKNKIWTIDLKTYKVELYRETGIKYVVPYMSFYTPELEASCTGEAPSAGDSSA